MSFYTGNKRVSSPLFVMWGQKRWIYAVFWQKSQATPRRRLVFYIKNANQ